MFATNCHLVQLVVGLLHGGKAGLREFCSSNPEGSPLFYFFIFFLSFFPFLFSELGFGLGLGLGLWLALGLGLWLALGLGLWLALGLGLWLGLGYEAKKSNRETISQSFSDKIPLSLFLYCARVRVRVQYARV